MKKHPRGGLLAVLVIVALALAGLAAFATSAQAASPQNTAKPTISDGNFTVGDVATANEGTWSNTPTSYSYRWERCDTNGANCATIAGATAKTYTLTTSDVDHTLVVEVTATNADGSAATTSDPSPIVTTDTAPVNTERPSVSGDALVGSTLTANEGTWSNGVRSYSYQWQRCDANGFNCSDIAGATGKTYNVSPADAGKTLRVRVTAQNPAGSTSATSDRTALVGTPQPAAACGTTADKVTTLSDGTKSVPVEALNLPDRLVVDRLNYSPSAISRRGQTVVAHFHVSEVVGNCSVAGALVYVVGVPFNTLTTAPENATGTDGWVSVSFRVKGNARLRHNDLVVLFVRARKPGDNLLAGISTRRLVSVRYVGR